MISTLKSRERCIVTCPLTVECRDNAVKYCKVLHKKLEELGQNINHILD